jgi:beta-aspartyl-peptidase (threonine type)
MLQWHAISKQHFLESEILMIPTIIVHGGAGWWADEQDAPKSDYIIEAMKVGCDILNRGGSALDAVEKAVNVLEDAPIFDAGRGSHLNIEGMVQMDAIIIDARTRDFGAVAGVEQVRYPISLARRVMQDTEHKFIVGAGAEKLALQLGIPLVPNMWFVTDEELTNYRNRVASQTYDTVGAVAIDANGNIAAATSTGGTSHKLPGRVGDAPLFGAGGYADNDFGGTSATGVGENSMRILLSKYVVDQIGLGKDAQAASVAGLEYANRFFEDSQLGVITVDKQGRVGAAHTTDKLACGWVDANGNPCASMKGGIYADV